MTPSPAAADGGCGEMLFIRAPKGPVPEYFGSDTFLVLYRRLRGSPNLYRFPTPGFTRGYNCFTPSGFNYAVGSCDECIQALNCLPTLLQINQLIN